MHVIHKKITIKGACHMVLIFGGIWYIIHIQYIQKKKKTIITIIIITIITIIIIIVIVIVIVAITIIIRLQTHRINLLYYSPLLLFLLLPPPLQFLYLFHLSMNYYHPNYYLEFLLILL